MVKHSADSDQPPRVPALRVIHGDATPEQIAALVAVLMAARSAEADVTHEPARSAWSYPADQLRHPLFPGSGAWRRSALPG